MATATPPINSVGPRAEPRSPTARPTPDRTRLEITPIGLPPPIDPDQGEAGARGLATGAPEEQETEQQVRATDRVTGPHPVVVETA